MEKHSLLSPVCGYLLSIRQLHAHGLTVAMSYLSPNLFTKRHLINIPTSILIEVQQEESVSSVHTNRVGEIEEWASKSPLNSI